MATDRASLKIQEAGGLNTFQTGGVPVADALNTISTAHSDLFQVYKAAADGAAATATAETFTGLFLPQTQGVSVVAGQRAYKVNGIYFNPTSSGYTADNTNNATITVQSRDVNGLNPVLVGTLLTNIASGNAAQGQTMKFTLNSVGINLPFGATLTYTIAKGGAGVVVPAGAITLDIEAI